MSIVTFILIMFGILLFFICVNVLMDSVFESLEKYTRKRSQQ
jgi:hypothetical protein